MNPTPDGKFTPMSSNVKVYGSFNFSEVPVFELGGLAVTKPMVQLVVAAAVVFVFHGRYCVYVPEHGTVPFRARGGTENLRMIQELVRRFYPGASGFKKL